MTAIGLSLKLVTIGSGICGLGDKPLSEPMLDNIYQATGYYQTYYIMFL